MDYLNRAGFEALREHEAALTKRALEIFAEFPAATVYGPKDAGSRGGIVSFNIEGVHPHDVGTAFDLEGVAVRAGHHCCQPLMGRLKVGGTARASFYLYNTLDDVEALGRALSKTAAFFKRPAGVK